MSISPDKDLASIESLNCKRQVGCSRTSSMPVDQLSSQPLLKIEETHTKDVKGT